MVKLITCGASGTYSFDIFEEEEKNDQFLSLFTIPSIQDVDAALIKKHQIKITFLLLGCKCYWIFSLLDVKYSG
ncbi:hypothetical protein DXT90_17555 [Agrobacterium tumefaciens]|mgnify:CR=1 FL=1|nr:hypothetical protein ASD74_10055 [Rhizobium sp. Root564]MQB22434.1 hypothetical protein [Agrobacterium tumefaciens]